MEWFGQIPQNWEVMPLWTLLSPRINKNTEGQEQNLLSLSYGRIIRKDIETRTGLLPASFNGYNIIEAGDIVLRLTDLQNDMRSLRSGLAKEHGIITSAYLSLKPTKEGQDTRYFHYLLHSFDLIKGFYNMGEGIRQNLNYDELSSLKLPLPPLDEQSRIASYLDSHIAKIDDSIARYKALSDKLDGYRKAVITKAVTEGVRGRRSKKDSGLDWLVTIPTEWSCSKIKHECELHGRIGWNGLRSDEFKENSYSYLVTGQDFVGSEIDWTKCFQIGKERYDEDIFIQIHNGEILVTKDGTIGKVAIVSNLDKPACLNSGIFVVRQKKNLFIPKYLYWQLASPLLKSFNDYSNLGGTTIVHLYQKTFEQMPLIIPPIDEQAEIVAYLDKKCSDIDSSKDKIESVIKKLEEYKKSLIYNAVTGKIEC